MIRVAIIGAGGYTGVAYIDIILRAPEAKMTNFYPQQEFGRAAAFFSPPDR
jgi:N-acetyl-gamma-glutamylphosphate reductase